MVRVGYYELHWLEINLAATCSQYLIQNNITYNKIFEYRHELIPVTFVPMECESSRILKNRKLIYKHASNKRQLPFYLF